MPSDLKFPGRSLQDETAVPQNIERHFARQLAQLDAMTAVALKLLKAPYGPGAGGTRPSCFGPGMYVPE